MINDKLLRKILKEQKKTDDILIELHLNGIQMNGRTWRRFVRQFNNDFDKHDRYIASNKHGYYLTSNKKMITKTISNKYKNALSMLKNAKKDFENLSKKDQLSLLKEDPDIYDLITKMEI